MFVDRTQDEKMKSYLIASGSKNNHISISAVVSRCVKATPTCRGRGEPMVWYFSTNVASSKMEDAEIYLKIILKNYSENNCDFQALFLKDTEEYIGEAGILAHIMPNNRAVVGYNLLPEYWGNGYATEITKAFVKYLFEVEKVERIEALVGYGNGASRKVLEKSGFMQEGLLRNFGYIHNRLINVYYYGIIREDYYGMPIKY